MTPAERIELIGLLWESLSMDPDSVPVTDAQRIELRRRVVAHEQDPTAAIAWPEFRDELDRE